MCRSRICAFLSAEIEKQLAFACLTLAASSLATLWSFCVKCSNTPNPLLRPKHSNPFFVLPSRLLWFVVFFYGRLLQKILLFWYSAILLPRPKFAPQFVFVNVKNVEISLVVCSSRKASRLPHFINHTMCHTYRGRRWASVSYQLQLPTTVANF